MKVNISKKNLKGNAQIKLNNKVKVYLLRKIDFKKKFIKHENSLFRMKRVNGNLSE